MGRYDLVIVGAGAAGLTLAHRASSVVLPGVGTPRIALVEPPAGAPRSKDRTWCFWERGVGPWDGILAARWDTLTVISHPGERYTRGISPQSYKMLRSRDFEAYVHSRLGAGVDLYTATVTDIDDGADNATVSAERPDGQPLELEARWAFDSRPLASPPRAHTTLLQHFRGWFVRADTDVFDADSALLMDFRTPQPRNGVAFGYVLPLSAREALVEYTEFTREVLDDGGYDRALRQYTEEVLGLKGLTLVRTEQGVIPMTDGAFSPRTGRRTFRIGAAGGATRPSTGYTFSGIQRQVDSVMRHLEQGRTPVPPLPHHRRHRAMDAILLRALDTGRLSGAEFFARLFARNDMRDVLDFLDGHSAPRREFAMGMTTPLLTMSITTLERALVGVLPPGRS
ncbi:lycopene cyclase [Spiractinospora alimapuensis]|uniref:lycopene cyclase family protein n=1 Tax=Spiractinospora alimapuensis TaxID=2820884 RepID=UPI001F333EEC|nr:lycopene cyclase family protein [Spiractinospora alimapuensis]QVQ54253.1 lycopene cyclase [Spiractinospora alimapuensis]